MPIQQRRKKRKLAYPPGSTSPSEWSVEQQTQSPQPWDGDNPVDRPVAVSDQLQHEEVRDVDSEQRSRATASEKPRVTTTSESQPKASHRDIPSLPIANHDSAPHPSQEYPPGMMLFPISQIKEVLDIYDRRKQRIQYLEAQVDDLQTSLDNAAEIAKLPESRLANDHAAPTQQRSLVAALGRALVRCARITDLNELYNLLEDLGVDQSHYWALSENPEFRTTFPRSDKPRGTGGSGISRAEVEGGAEESPPRQQALDAIDRAASSSTNDTGPVPTQPTTSS